MLPLIILGAVTLPLVGIGIIFLVMAAIKYYTTKLAITNKRAIAKFGFISRETTEVGIQKIEGIRVSQGILGRIFDHGSIFLSGSGINQAPIPGIKRPMEFRRVFLDIQENGVELKGAEPVPSIA